MTLWAKVLSLFALAPLTRLPEERRLDHTLNNYVSSMEGAQRQGLRLAREIQQDPERESRIRRREALTSAVQAVARESTKDRSVARIEDIARSLRDNP